MTVYFYRWDPGRAAPPSPELPPGVEVRLWRPGRDGFPSKGSISPQNIVWWGMTLSRLLASRDFAEISLWRDGRRLHRLIVTPRWRRFPFMAADDLQIGAVWTHPEARGLGLARAAVAIAHRQVAASAKRLWYIVETGNAPSIRLIESCGYRRVGVGRRSRPLGIRALGQFRLETLL